MIPILVAFCLLAGVQSGAGGETPPTARSEAPRARPEGS